MDADERECGNECRLSLRESSVERAPLSRSERRLFPAGGLRLPAIPHAYVTAKETPGATKLPIVRLGSFDRRHDRLLSGSHCPNQQPAG
jgi:hypothetical protein